jgi:hypothetical protein
VTEELVGLDVPAFLVGLKLRGDLLPGPLLGPIRGYGSEDLDEMVGLVADGVEAELVRYGR